MAQDLTNEVLLERALRDLSRIEDEAARAGGDLSVLACLVDMAADEAREQLAMLKRDAGAGFDSELLARSRSCDRMIGR